MQLSVLKTNRRKLARGCAVLMVAGMAAGCSSQVARFGEGLDSVATASTNNQRLIIGQQNVSQPYPGDSIENAPVGVSQAPVSRSSLPAPASVQPLPPVQQTQTLPPVAQEPMRTAAVEVDRTVHTGTVNKPFQAAGGEAPRLRDNQPRQKATEIVVESGQTISGLSRRYGVPADVIMKANGLSETNGLKAGSKIVIPAYGYSVKRQAGSVVADAKPMDERAPAPVKQTEKVAVLPQQPKLKDSKPALQPAVSADANDPFIVGKSDKAAQKTAATEPKAKAGVSGTYTVQSGDTLSAISRKTGVSTAALKQANGMSDGLIRIGQTLKIPSGAAAPAAAVASTKPAPIDPVKTASTPPAAKATPADTLASYTPPKKDKVIEAAVDEDAVAPDATGIGKMRWPVRGRVISGFGGGKEGDGIDISVPEGTPVKAAENGVVIYAGNGLKEFGNTVLVRHEDGLVTVYGHASTLDVTRGQKVKRGQQIATSGMSGTTDSPKLHFEVRKNSAPVDPRKFLE